MDGLFIDEEEEQLEPAPLDLSQPPRSVEQLDALGVLSSGGLYDPAKIAEEEKAAYDRAVRNTQINQAFGGLGRAADIIYQGYTGEKSPVAGLQAQKLAAEDNPMQDFEKSKKERREEIKQALMNKLKMDLAGKKAAAQAEKEGKAEGWRQKNYELNERRTRAAEKAADMKTAEKAEGERLPTGAVAEISDMDSAVKSIDDLYNNYKKLASEEINLKKGELGSGIKSWIRGTDANKYERTKGALVKSLGKLVEGGKMTDVDYEYALQNLPQATDTDAEAEAKIGNLRNFMTQKRDSYASALGKSGYNVKNLTKPGTAGASDIGSRKQDAEGNWRVKTERGWELE